MSSQTSETLSEQVRLRELMAMSNCPENYAIQNCPVRDVLDLIGDKWSVLVVLNLGERGVLRFSELQQRIPAISKRMLSITLQQLERDGLAQRRVVDRYPPRVEYALSEMGISLLTPINALAQWALEHQNAIQSARQTFAGREEARAPWLDEKPSLRAD